MSPILYGAGDMQLLAYKAASSSYMYGQDFHYFVKVYSYLEKENNKDLLCFLDTHRHYSHGIYQQFQHKGK